MALVSLKRTNEDDMCCGGWSPSNYPGGCSIYLNDEQCEALGLTKALKPGSQVTITATAVVESSTESLDRDQDGGGNDVSVQLQITDMSVKPSGTMRNAATELYGDA